MSGEPNDADALRRSLDAHLQSWLQARSRLESAQNNLANARDRAQDARDDFNNVSKKYDEALLNLRALSPEGTDWANRKERDHD